MFAKIAEVSESLKCFNLSAITLGVTTKTPLENQVAMHGLTRVQKDFPNLTDSDYDEKNKVFRLNNMPEDRETEILFRASDSSSFDFSWGSKAAFGSREDVEKIFTSIEEGFSILSVNLELLDFQVHYRCNLDGHHYAAIWEAYYKNTPLYRLFDPKLMLQDDLLLRSYLDQHTVCVIRIKSDVSDAEVRTGKFKDDTLQASAGIARIRSFPIGKPFSDMMIEHLTTVVPFVEEKFLGCVVLPLDKTFSEIEDEGGQGDES